MPVSAASPFAFNFENAVLQCGARVLYSNWITIAWRGYAVVHGGPDQMKGGYSCRVRIVEKLAPKNICNIHWRTGG